MSRGLRSLTSLASGALQLGLLGSLLARSLIAPGFMPGSWDHGPFLVLCHGGLAPAAMERWFAADEASAEPTSRHHHHDHQPVVADPGDSDSGPPTGPPLTHDQLCPLGDALSAVSTLPQAFSWSIPAPSNVPDFAPAISGNPTFRAIGFLARAPPGARQDPAFSGL